MIIQREKKLSIYSYKSYVKSTFEKHDQCKIMLPITSQWNKFCYYIVSLKIICTENYWCISSLQLVHMLFNQWWCLRSAQLLGGEGGAALNCTDLAFQRLISHTLVMFYALWFCYTVNVVNTKKFRIDPILIYFIGFTIWLRCLRC